MPFGLGFGRSPRWGLGLERLRPKHAAIAVWIALSPTAIPAGAITHSVYDGIYRLASTWIGTDDSTTDGSKWTPTNGSASSNMTQVTASEYDNGGIGVTCPP